MMEPERLLNHKIRPDAPNQMDGIALMRALDDECISLAFFDPQYRGVLDKLKYGNEGVKRGQGRSALPQMDENTICAFLQEIDRVLKKSGHLMLWVDKFHLCEGIRPWVDGTRLETVDMIVWNKQRIGMGYRTRRTAEYLVVFQKRPKCARGVWVDHTIADVWAERAGKEHPHQKPGGLQEKLIRAVTNEGDWVLDPAAGSYSVLQACRATNRRFVGGDLIMRVLD